MHLTAAAGTGYHSKSLFTEMLRKSEKAADLQGKTGAPGFEPGTSPTELWAESGGV